jgi:hypothetical protein
MAKSSSRKVSPAEKKPPSGSVSAKPKSANPETKVISFQQALLEAGEKNRHVLLGNGFSIAVRAKIFTYHSLFSRAKESGMLTPELQRVFDELGTTDFEQVMEALQNAANLVRFYEKTNPALAQRLDGDAEKLRDVLAETIASNHPTRPHDLSDDQYLSCRHFLANFNRSVYTLNYDLLLYWTLMQSELDPEVNCDDGFRNGEDRNEDFVLWEIQNTNSQNIFYLHGALHIYDAGADLVKYTWKRTDVALIDQIKKSLGKREYPLIVTEGTSEQKMERIQHSSFLGRAYRSFAGVCAQRNSSLFIYGHSLASSDEHLLKLIDHGKIGKVFVGLYGDPASEANRKLIARANLFATRRHEDYPLIVRFFGAESAHVWDRDASA